MSPKQNARLFLPFLLFSFHPSLVSALDTHRGQQSLYADFVPGEAVVKVSQKNLFKKSLKSLSTSLHIKRELNLLAGDYVIVQNQGSQELSSFLNQLSQLPGVESVDPNAIYHVQGARVSGLDVLLSGRNDLLWGLNNTGKNEPNRDGNPSGAQGVAGADVAAFKAWNRQRGSDKVTIAVIDTGIDYNHPNLRDNIWVNEGEIPGNNQDDDKNGFVDDVYGYDFVSKDGDPMDGNDHGTHCAGTIGAAHLSSADSIKGVMANVKMMGVKFLSDSGSGTLADAIEAIDYATRMNVDIMSNSWGGGGYTQALFDVIKTASDRGILFVAAAGNSSSNNDTRPSYPASYQTPNMVAVASHTHADTMSSFSSFGKRTVHVAAPGSNVLSTTPNAGYSVFSGTSMATPHVSGVLGLYLSQFGRGEHSLVINRLMATSNPVAAYKKTTASGGRVDAFNMLTNTRPPRQEPNPDLWKTQALAEVFETAHPYKENTKLSKTYTVAGAKFLRVIVEKYDLELNYDFFSVKDKTGAVVEKISGQGTNFTTEYVEGDTFTLEMTSDYTQNAWGVLVKSIQVIK